MNNINNQNGAIAVLTAILMTAFLGFVALAVDSGYLVASKNELQNAADAAALAGARELYLDDGSAVDPGANQVAYDTAIKNFSAKDPVEVIADLNNNTGDIQRGHWSFGRGIGLDGGLEKGFYLPDDPNTTEATDLFGQSLGELDNNNNFVNAVKVTVRREATPINTFFAKIFSADNDNIKMSATAVAYIGFAGSFAPGELNAPFAICLESITNDDGDFLCNIGRAMPSGQGTDFNNPTETGGWTDFEQTDDNVCNGNGLTAGSVDTAISFGNLETLNAGTFDTGNGGFGAMDEFQLEFLAQTDGGIRPWVRKIPVISCPDGSIGNCSELVGGVDIEILWVTRGGVGHLDAPTQMESNDDFFEDWDGTGIEDTRQRFYDFADHFGLPTIPDAEMENQQENGGVPYTPLVQSTIYFKPSCKPAIPSGVTGGSNLGVLAQIPVLVD